MSNEIKARVLFVCMGNICRSPTAEGVFRQLLREAELDGQVETESAGTHGYHVGRPPDPRAQEAARKRGVEISDLRARQVEFSDYEYFDYLLAMDRGNLDILLAEAPQAHRDKVRMYLEFAAEASQDEVPDPYYGGDRGFARVLDLVEEGARGFLEHLRRQHGI